MSLCKILLSVVFTGAALAAASVSIAQTAPVAPKLCLDGACPKDAIKWNPGHYMGERSFQQKASVVVPDIADSKGPRFSHYDAADFKNNPNIKGVVVRYRWSQLEGDSRGDYSSGMSYVRAELDKLEQLYQETGHRKRLILRVFDDKYNASSIATASQYYPRYLIEAGKVFHRSSTNGSKKLQWKRWDSSAMGWFIDMLAAYGKEFDSNPNFEMIVPWTESAISVTGTIDPAGATADYSDTALVAQYKRLASALRAGWPTSQVWMPHNWIPDSVSVQTGLYLHYESVDCGSGNPDTHDDMINGYQGMRADTILRGELSGSSDFRGRMPIVFAVEDSSLGYNSVGNLTAQEAYDYVNFVMKANYMLWDRNTWVGTDDQRWYAAGTTQPGGILKVINAKPLFNTSLPSSLR